MKKSFTEGSVVKHLLTMMFASWVAMASNMLLSIADMYFLSRLNDVDVLAAIGFAGSVGMFPASVGIGFSIAISVLVSQCKAKDGRDKAGALFSAILCMAMLLSGFIALALWFFLSDLLSLLGAQKSVHAYALSYLQLTMVSAPLSVLLMSFASGLRAVAMAKASMWVSLIATIINFILDPFLIEVLGWGIEGAAWATIIARVIAVLIGLWFLAFKLRFIHVVSLSFIKQTFIKVRKIALPTVLSNFFTPIGGLIVVSVVSQYGAQAMAGLAVVGSLSPILFSVYFSLTGAAGPMVGQNIGANQPHRIGQIYRTCLMVLFAYTLFIWLLLMALYPLLVSFYSLSGLAASLLKLYCYVQTPLSVGLGVIALSNGIFNNLGKPQWSMYLNVLRSSVVTLLLCYIGAWLFGVYGAVMASSVSFILFGCVAAYLASRLFSRRFSRPFSRRYSHLSLFLPSKA